MKQKFTTKKPICSKNNDKYVGAERIGTRPIPTMPAHNKGITLIALIITIIVLLILAAVAIAAIKGDGIISHAKNAKTQYTGAQANEQELLSNYELMLAEETGNAWKQDKTKVTKGNTTLNVGDTIKNFTAGEKTWKVLGAENGKLLLTTTENVVTRKTISGSDATLGVWDEKTSSYKNAEDELNKICVDNISLDNLTDEIKLKVTEVRSMKVEDINRITGYNPAATGDGKVFGEGELYQYGNKVTYSMNASGKVAYSSAIKSSDETSCTQFWLPNTSTNITSPYTVTSNFYIYDVGSDTGLEKSSNAYKLLFKDSEQSYWLASSCVSVGEDTVNFELRYANNGSVSSLPLWDSSSGGYNYYNGVRPVVSLASDFQPEK